MTLGLINNPHSLGPDLVRRWDQTRKIFGNVAKVICKLDTAMGNTNTVAQMY